MKKPSLRFEKGAWQKMCLTKALHSPHQTTILLSTPL